MTGSSRTHSLRALLLAALAVVLGAALAVVAMAPYRPFHYIDLLFTAPEIDPFLWAEWPAIRAAIPPLRFYDFITRARLQEDGTVQVSIISSGHGPLAATGMRYDLVRRADGTWEVGRCMSILA